MNIGVVGLSHHTAPLEVRERFALDQRAAARVIARALAPGPTREAVVLSTCNRTELYWVSQAEAQAQAAALIGILSEEAGVEGYAGFEGEVGREYFYLHRGAEAARHLFRVAASLDSLVVGEAQIQGQVKEAYERAASAALDPKPVGPTLARLFERALAVGGRVRSETALGTGAGSIPSAAVELARKVFGSLKGKRALLLGAGDMSELAGVCLRDAGVSGIAIASRGETRALTLAERLEGRLVPLDELPDELAKVDIVATATSSADVVLSRSLLERATRDGRRRPLFVMDMGVPRDVEAAVGDIDGVFLYDIDDLRQIVDANLRRRRSELPVAEAIVDEAVSEFAAWQASLEVVPTIRALRDRAEAIRRAEVEKALRRLPSLDDATRAEVEKLTRQLLNKMLHTPTAKLREAAANGDGVTMLGAARRLFGLPDSDRNLGIKESTNQGSKESGSANPLDTDSSISSLGVEPDAS